MHWQAPIFSLHDHSCRIGLRTEHTIKKNLHRFPVDISVTQVVQRLQVKYHGYQLPVIYLNFTRILKVYLLYVPHEPSFEFQ